MTPYAISALKVEANRGLLDQIHDAIASSSILRIDIPDDTTPSAQDWRLREILASAQAYPSRKGDETLKDHVRLSLNAERRAILVIPKRVSAATKAAISRIAQPADADAIEGVGDWTDAILQLSKAIEDHATVSFAADAPDIEADISLFVREAAKASAGSWWAREEKRERDDERIIVTYACERTGEREAPTFGDVL